MAKARDAFRTISEVSEWLDTPAHVLRFWESKFTQVKPVKRAGGRRYYRPDDMALLAGIKTLLHEQGMTIKGAQTMLREKGVKYVAELPNADGIEADQPEKAPEIKSVTPVDDVPDAVVIEAAPEIDAVEAPQEPAVAAPMAPAMPPPMMPVAMNLSAPETVAEAAPEPAPEPAALPVDVPSAEPRIFGLLQNADRGRLRDNADKIAPLLARLEEVRDRMRAS